MKIFLSTILLLNITAGFAQHPGSSNWFTLVTPVQLSQRWQWHNDAGYRTLGLGAEASQYFYRTGIRYAINSHLSAAVGTAWFFTRTNFNKQNGEFGHEFRLWQELTWRQPAGSNTTIDGRVRTEERFFATTSNESSFTAYRIRLRTALTQKISAKWSIQFADEYMQQLRAGTASFTFNQNRVFATMQYQANSSTHLQAGYMWLLWPAFSQHIVNISIQKKISLYAGSRHSK
jgi:hypothetical protein